MIIVKEENVKILSERINEGVNDKGLGLKAFLVSLIEWTCAEMTKICPILSYFLESSYFYYIFHTRLILNESAIKSDKLGFGPKALALQTHENIPFKYVHCCVEIILILYPTFKFMIYYKVSVFDRMKANN